MAQKLTFRIKNKIKSIIRKNKKLNQNIFYLRMLLFNRSALEQKKSFGELNKDKTIYIIRPLTNGVEGLMSLFNFVMRRVDYAYRAGYVPVIDMKNYHTQYADGSDDNIWEWYFSQPDSISLEDAYKSKKVILSGFRKDDYLGGSERLFAYDCMVNESFRQQSSRLISDHIKIIDDWEKVINIEAERINISECIGVYVRGTDYLRLKPAGVRIQPDVDMVIEKTKEFVKKYDAPVYVVTEDQSLYERIEKEFPDVRTISNDVRISDYKGNDFLSKSGVLSDDKKTLGGVYLTKIMLLSKCRFFVGGITSGSIAAVSFKDTAYEDKYVFDLGSYD